RVVGKARRGGRGSKGEAFHAAAPWPSHSGLQAQQPHHRRRRRAPQRRGGLSVGQKVHPKGFRLNITENWDSRWFARREYSDLLQEDVKSRNFLKKSLYTAVVPKID